LIFEFADCRVNPDSRELLRNGAAVSIEPRTLDLLLYLIQNRERAVGKDELQDEVWGTIVSDAALTRAVMKLRKAVGERDGGITIIKTVPRFGYRFVADLRADGTPGPSAAVAAGRQAIAVLPLVNMSGDADNNYFSDGIAEEILNLLARMPALRVASRTSSFAFRNSQQTLKEIAEVLDVDVILEGSVRKAGNRVRITIQLIDAQHDAHLWSEIYDRELTDIFAIQAEIAREVVSAVTRSESGAIRSYEATSSPDAYDLYLKGRQLFYEWDGGRVARARSHFQRAIEIDPGYARAWAGLAYTSAALFMWWQASQENLRSADAASLKALELAPELAEAHTARGFALTLLGDFEQAVRRFERALELDPLLYDAWYLFGRARFAQGELAESARLFIEAGKVRPDDPVSVALAGNSFQAMKDGENEKIWCREAVRRALRHLELNPSDTRVLVLGASCYQEIGELEKGEAWIVKALDIAGEDIAVLHNAGCFYAAAGQIDKALDLFEKRFALGDAYLDWIDNDPDFDSIRDHPRFRKMIGRE